MRSELLNGGAYCRTAFAAINKTATAAGSGDATEVDGSFFDRLQSDAGPFLSAKLVITYTTTLTATKTLSFAVQFQDATSSGAAAVADYGDAIAATVVATGESGGSTETGTVEIDIDLAAAREFVRAQITPDLSASGTDTCEWSAAYVLFGPKTQPCSSAIGSVGGPA